MARGNFALHSFNAGEVSKNALTRIDVAKLRLAAQCQTNWLPYVVGPMMLRPGLIYTGEVLSDKPCKLIRFVYSKNDTSLIELTANNGGVSGTSGAGNLRIWINEVLLTRPAVSTAILDSTFTGSGGFWDTTVTGGTTSGALATVTGGVATLTCTPVAGLAQIRQTVTVAAPDRGVEHGLRIVVTDGPVTVRLGSANGLQDVMTQTVLDTGVHSLSFTPTVASFKIEISSIDAWNKTLTSCAIEAAGVVLVPTPWAAADLANIRYDQSGDIIYVACYGQQQQMIQRRGVRPGARGWSVVQYKTNDGPFLALPTIPNATMTPSVYYGNGTLTSSNPFFQPGHVGALVRLFCQGQINNCVLGGQGAFCDPLRITGVSVEREIIGTISGTWTGKLTLQRSFVNATTGFTISSAANNPVTFTGNGNFSYNDVTSFSSQYSNVVVWLRIGFANPGDYGSGSANITWTNSGDLFFPSSTSAAAGMGGQYAVVRITGYTSPTVVNIEAITSPESLALGMVTPISTTNGTALWVEGQWSGVQGWPTSVCIHEGRLCWFGGGTAWLSASDAYTNFAPFNFDGTSAGDGGAINVTLGSGPADTVSWGISGTRLLLGREQSIGSCRSSNFDQPLTPTGIVIRDCSDQGAERLPAIKVGKRVVFVQQSNRKVYELSFSGQELDYDDRDLTRLNLDIGVPGYVDIDKATQPDKMVWLPRGDGQVACLLYDTRDEVEAWWRLQTLGVVENVAVLPSAGLEDNVYFVVNRTINGVTRRFIERLARRDQCVGGALNYQLDSALVYSGSPVSTVSLPWLPNTLVAVWADGHSIGSATTNGSGTLVLPDGGVHSNIVAGLAGRVVTATTATPTTTMTVGTQYNNYPAEVFADIGGTGSQVHIGSLVVSGGAVTLPNGQSATVMTACLGYTAPFMSAKLAYAAQMTTALNQRKRVAQLGLVAYDMGSQALQYGQRMDVLDSLPLLEADQPTPAATVWSSYDMPMFEIPGEYNSDARLCLLAQAPNPVTVGGVVVQVVTNER